VLPLCVYARVGVGVPVCVAMLCCAELTCVVWCVWPMLQQLYDVYRTEAEVRIVQESCEGGTLLDRWACVGVCGWGVCVGVYVVFHPPTHTLRLAVSAFICTRTRTHPPPL
jgi:hypothetical protein